MKWNETALDILRALANVFHVDEKEIIYTYTDWEYATHYYIHNNDELLVVVRDLVQDSYDTYKMCECTDLFPAALLPFLA